MHLIKKINLTSTAARKAKKEQQDQPPTEDQGEQVQKDQEDQKDQKDQKTFEAGFFCIQSPVKSPRPVTPLVKPSLLKAVLSSEAKKASVTKVKGLSLYYKYITFIELKLISH